jgi:TolB protein
MRRIITALAVTFAAAGVLLSITAAQATVYGQNGRIAFRRFHPTKRIGMRAALRRAIVIVTALAMAVLGLLAVSGPARAAFPGAVGRIAFMSANGGCCNISTMNADGSQVNQLTHVTSGTQAVDPFWSPDGTAIVFDRRNVVGSQIFGSQIWIMRADGSSKHRLLPDPFFLDFSPSYSPDGKWIVFTRCRPDFTSCAVYRMNADGAALTAITPFTISVRDFQARYSPDGSTIAFDSSDRGGVQSAVYLMHRDGSHIQRLTRPGLIATSPEWSPDGSRILFTTHCCALRQTAEVWVINVDRTGAHQLTFPGQRHDFSPSFAPSGDRIAFERDSADFSHFAMWVMNTDGTGLTKIRGNSGEPAWGTAP